MQMVFSFFRRGKGGSGRRTPAGRKIRRLFRFFFAPRVAFFSSV
jgi:hypothetical protein